MEKVEMSGKYFLLLVCGAFALGLLSGVIVSFPGWARYGVEIERSRPKTAVELIDGLRELGVRLEERLGIERFFEKYPPDKTVMM